MEKGALLPLRFYPSLEWRDYEKTKNYSGDPGVVLFREHHIMMPSFQMVMPDIGMHWGIQDFQAVAGPPPPVDGTFTLRRYDEAAGAFDMWSFAVEEQYGLFVKAGSHRNIVWNRFPFFNQPSPPTGLWYFRFGPTFLHTKTVTCTERFGSSSPSYSSVSLHRADQQYCGTVPV